MSGADDQNRTGDLILTKDTLYRLSYISIWLRGLDLNQRPSGYEPDELPTAPPRDVWWREKDSNLRSQRRQIYSLLPLTTRESLHGLSLRINWSWQKELNPQPTDYKSVALPIELCQRFSFVTSVSIKDVGVFVNNFFKKSVRNFINQKSGG